MKFAKFVIIVAHINTSFHLDGISRRVILLLRLISRHSSTTNKSRRRHLYPFIGINESSLDDSQRSARYPKVNVVYSLRLVENRSFITHLGLKQCKISLYFKDIWKHRFG